MNIFTLSLRSCSSSFEHNKSPTNNWTLEMTNNYTGKEKLSWTSISYKCFNMYIIQLICKHAFSIVLEFVGKTQSKFEYISQVVICFIEKLLNDCTSWAMDKVKYCLLIFQIVPSFLNKTFYNESCKIKKKCNRHIVH